MPLSTGQTSIDRLFGCNGLETRQVTEIFGKSGTGKSTFCLSLCLQVQLSLSKGGLAANSIYICTSSRFSIKRLNQLMVPFLADHPDLNESDLLEGIQIIHVRERETLIHMLKYQLPNLIKSFNIKLIVIDTLAAVFRVNDGGGTSSKASAIFETCMALHRLAYTGIVILVVNEVSARFPSVKR